MKSKVLITKDILLPRYLPVYGSKDWKTPNIDELAEKGTVFHRHYTVAPSTAMAFTSMSTGRYPYELNRKVYKHVETYKDSLTLFDEFKLLGYENHILWSNNYMSMALPYSRSFGEDNGTTIHCLDLNRPVGPHFNGVGLIELDEERANKIVDLIYDEINSIDFENKKIYLWIHLPHVLLGRCAYGDDIDLLDKIVGFLRTKFDDDSIYISADHGNMDGLKGKYGYGFDVYESAIRIPLITPRVENKSHIDFPTSNIQLKSLIIDGKVPKAPYILSDTAYYGQLHRKLAIIVGKYKYIYNKFNNSEELYDVEYDKNENVNLIEQIVKYDERKITYNLKEVYYYPHWEEAYSVLEECRKIFLSVWRKSSVLDEFKMRAIYIAKRILMKPYQSIKRRKSKYRK